MLGYGLKMLAEWAIDLLRIVFYALDSLIYGLIGPILRLIFDMSSLTASFGLIENVYTRIYVVLGIFMAFKLSFSFLQYIIDPESMVGKSEKGVTKLISNTIIMIIALVTIPKLLFGSADGPGLLSRAQDAFLPMLPRLLLGISEDSGVSIGNGSNSEDIENTADVLSISALQAFFVPNKNLDELCGAGTYDGTPPVTSFDQFGEYLKLKCNGVDGGKYYRYDYIFIISTGVGLFMCYILLSIGIDVGKRVFKMLILELVAPIPIMSLIDPKSSKSGTFSKWLQLLITTFLDIFVKLGILYLVLTLLKLIVSNGLFSNWPDFADEPLRSSLLLLALILSLLFFAKEAPNFIKESLGMKTGKDGLGLGSAGALLGGATAIGGAALSGVAATATRFRNADGIGGKAWALTGGALGAGLGTAAAVGRAGMGVASGKKSGDITKAQDAANQKRLAYAKANSTWYGRAFFGADSSLFGESLHERSDAKIEALAAASKASSAIDDAFKKEAVTKGKGSVRGYVNGAIDFRNSNVTMGMIKSAMETSNPNDPNVVIDGVSYNKYELSRAMPGLEDRAVDNFEASYTQGSNADIDNLMFEYDSARSAAHLGGKSNRPNNREDRKNERTSNTVKQTKIRQGRLYQSSKRNSNGGKGGKK